MRQQKFTMKYPKILGYIKIQQQRFILINIRMNYIYHMTKEIIL